MEAIEAAFEKSKSDNFHVGFTLACIRLRGLTVFETHYDFMPKVGTIDKTAYKLKGNRMIWAENPAVRKVHKRYFAESMRRSRQRGLRA